MRLKTKIIFLMFNIALGLMVTAIACRKKPDEPSSSAGSSDGGTTGGTTATLTVTNTSGACGQSLATNIVGIVSTTLTADASDDVGVTKVEFLDGSSVLATDTQAPYTATWNYVNASVGGHTITAKAYDADGNTATSACTITVKPPPGPV